MKTQLLFGVAVVLAGCSGSSYHGYAPPSPSRCQITESIDASFNDSDAEPSFAPTSPIGVGYNNVVNPFPPHTAYLTFDDGPSDWTNDFLDILKAKGVHATFFITARQLKGLTGLDGSYVDEYGNTEVYRDLVQRELNEGHVIGNHTVDHPDLGATTFSKTQEELDENELLINAGLLKAGGQPHVLSLFRPPFGSPWFDTTAVPASEDPAAQIIVGPIVEDHGVNVLWTLTATDSQDWVPDESYSRTLMPISTATSIINTSITYADKMTRIQNAVLNSPAVLNGDSFIVLMHDTHDTTRDVLSNIIDQLVVDGYTFSTIEQYVQWRWSRPSIDLTSGGCRSFGSYEVCGRMWFAYSTYCGQSGMGLPIANQVEIDGIVSQQFERGILELHPENATPDNIEFK